MRDPVPSPGGWQERKAFKDSWAGQAWPQGPVGASCTLTPLPVVTLDPTCMCPGHPHLHHTHTPNTSPGGSACPYTHVCIHVCTHSRAGNTYPHTGTPHGLESSTRIQAKIRTGRNMHRHAFPRPGPKRTQKQKGRATWPGSLPRKGPPPHQGSGWGGGEGEKQWRGGGCGGALLVEPDGRGGGRGSKSLGGGEAGRRRGEDAPSSQGPSSSASFSVPVLRPKAGAQIPPIKHRAESGCGGPV